MWKVEKAMNWIFDSGAGDDQKQTTNKWNSQQINQQPGKNHKQKNLTKENLKSSHLAERGASSKNKKIEMNWEGIEEWGKSGRNIGSGFEKIKLTIGAHMSLRYKTQNNRLLMHTNVITETG